MRNDPFTSHTAGHPLEVCSDWLFYLETDQQIWKHFNKKLLEIGANPITRTAHGALRFLQELYSQINGRADPPVPGDEMPDGASS